MADGNIPATARQAARSSADPIHDHALQATLARWNRARLAIQTPSGDWRADLDAEREMRVLEGEFLEATRLVQSERAQSAPREPQAFVAWFDALKEDGPGQGDPLFPWLAERATLDQMKWFVEQEAAGEAGFDDLVAFAQMKAPTQAKLELARNYWDEMGRGNAKGMHGPMLEALVHALKVTPTIEATVAPSLALGNTMAGLATNRRYAYHIMGALGVIELTAPGRAARVSQALRRLKVSAKARHYFDLHAVLDVKHSEAWNREVFHSIVAATPNAARWIAEGALMRLQCGAACFDLYRRHFWGDDGAKAPA
ncbi:iron-containing redox enzyme family protein [Terricaulis sp.]|uniref:iron-containing redox enzyme family protein n=1 Tax=Terricaulis sp. TaxID=2768686 RepID=UPI003783E9C4